MWQRTQAQPATPPNHFSAKKYLGINAAMLALTCVSVACAPNLAAMDLPWKDDARELLAQMGLWKHLTFFGAYAIAGTLPVPMAGLSLTAIGGTLYGPYGAILANLGGHALGLSTGFTTGRYALQPYSRALMTWSEQRFNVPWSRVNSMMAHNPLVGVAFVRMLPGIPFAVTNMLLGISPTPYRHYMAVSLMQLLIFVSGLSYLSGACLDLSETSHPVELPAWAPWLIVGSSVLNLLLTNMLLLQTQSANQIDPAL